MPDPSPSIDAGTRYVFAPYPYATEGGLYRIFITFETSRGDLFRTGTGLMATTLDVADNMCDALNSHLDLTREQWKCFSTAVFTITDSQWERAAEPAPETKPLDDDDPYYDDEHNQTEYALEETSLRERLEEADPFDHDDEDS